MSIDANDTRVGVGADVAPDHIDTRERKRDSQRKANKSERPRGPGLGYHDVVRWALLVGDAAGFDYRQGVFETTTQRIEVDAASNFIRIERRQDRCWRNTCGQRILKGFFGVVPLDWLTEQVTKQFVRFARAIRCLGDRGGRDDEQRTNVIARQVVVQSTVLRADGRRFLVVVVVLNSFSLLA